jgi:hypothetical protein
MKGVFLYDFKLINGTFHTIIWKKIIPNDLRSVLIIMKYIELVMLIVNRKIYCAGYVTIPAKVVDIAHSYLSDHCQEIASSETSSSKTFQTMEVHVINLTTNRIVKINIYFIYRFFRKLFQLNICNLNSKIHIRSCVFIDNEPRKKNYILFRFNN